jgi:hypothetical protein
VDVEADRQRIPVLNVVDLKRMKFAYGGLDDGRFDFDDGLRVFVQAVRSDLEEYRLER